MTKPLSVKDPYNIIITGVGGQGNVMASRVFANMLVRMGYRVTIGETFGICGLQTFATETRIWLMTDPPRCDIPKVSPMVTR